MYTDLAAALARAKERAGANSTADAYLTELLQMSAGTVEGVTHYRPFFVAARHLEQNQAKQQIIKAKGVEFTGLARPIASLFALQANYDSGYGLAIPAGFEAIATDSDATVRTQRFSTQSRSRNVRP